MSDIAILQQISFKDVPDRPCVGLLLSRRAYCIELATFENALLALLPTKRIVPTTITRMTASITAYSEMSWPHRAATACEEDDSMLHLCLTAILRSFPQTEVSTASRQEGVTQPCNSAYNPSMSDMAILRQLSCGGTYNAGRRPPLVSNSPEIIFGILIIIGCLVTPVALIRGWTGWARQPMQRSVPAIPSLAGFVFATASAVLAGSSVAYAQVHHFPFYDPLLLRIFRWGGLLSLMGILFGIGGAWRPGPSRWQAPVCGLGMLAFWLLAAEGE